jgi:folylpolyglutamate synthase/dihydropteroate synthase
LDQNGKKAEIAEDLKGAIERGLALTRKEDLLCITGSLYTVGEARAYLLPARES